MPKRPTSITYVAPVLQVSDLARSVAYYRNQLGFELEFAYEGSYASVLRDGCRVHLKCGGPELRPEP